MNKHDYNEGDTIQYTGKTGVLRTVKVTYKDDDLDGWPGFEGEPVGGGDLDEFFFWGYDYQITRVLRRANQ